MADNTLLIGGVLVAAGIAGYEYVSHQNASAKTGPQAAPTPVGFQPPANLLQMMQATYYLHGSPSGWQGRQTWITIMDQIVPSAGANAWSYVWDQWDAVSGQNGAWPSNSELQGWLKYAVDNGLNG